MKLSLILNNTTQRTPTRPAPPCGSRRIWEVDPATLSIITGVLLCREEVERILHGIGQDCGGAREDALRTRLLVGCGTPCLLAEQVERVLNGLTRELRGPVESCPMMQLADWWSSERDGMSGEQIAALLWCLCSDARPFLERLASRVSGALGLRAMRLLRDGASAPVERATTTEMPETSAVASDGPALPAGSEETAAAA
jgi:hypothetical protein